MAKGREGYTKKVGSKMERKSDLHLRRQSFQSAVDSEVLNSDWLTEGKLAEIPKWRTTGKCRIEKQTGKI